MKTVLSISIVAACIIFLHGCAPNLSEYQYLVDPQISTMPRQKMIYIELQGDPNIVGKQAFSALFGTFYKLKKNVKGMKMIPPRARWPKSIGDTPKNEWAGIYGLPVPENVESLPEKSKESAPDVRIGYWNYGEVAEILHIGPYSEETNTIETLHEFIAEKGYTIIGEHEEEYLKGPGMFFKGNPQKYQTIIRYRIEKE